MYDVKHWSDLIRKYQQLSACSLTGLGGIIAKCIQKDKTVTKNESATHPGTQNPVEHLKNFWYFLCQWLIRWVLSVSKFSQISPKVWSSPATNKGEAADSSGSDPKPTAAPYDQRVRGPEAIGKGVRAHGIPRLRPANRKVGSARADTAPTQETQSGSGKKYNTGAFWEVTGRLRTHQCFKNPKQSSTFAVQCCQYSHC